MAKTEVRKKKVYKELQLEERQCYALLALPIIGFLVFTIYPMVWAASKSFFYYDLIPSSQRFTGLENFIMAFRDKSYWTAWITTLEFSFIKIPIETVIALLLAVMLKKLGKPGGFFRTEYFLPTVIAGAVTAVIFANLFDYFGFINHWLDVLGVTKEPINWFASKKGALAVIIMASMWSCCGINVIYFTAALNNVPEELYEAAEIDGAGRARRFISITVPMIAPIFQTILLLAINGTLQTGEFIILMTNGAPGGATHTAASYIISKFVPGFAESGVNIGYGCALSIINSFIFGTVALIYSKLTTKLQNIY